jgi:hypothetical protein
LINLPDCDNLTIFGSCKEINTWVYRHCVLYGTSVLIHYGHLPVWEAEVGRRDHVEIVWFPGYADTRVCLAAIKETVSLVYTCLERIKRQPCKFINILILPYVLLKFKGQSHKFITLKFLFDLLGARVWSSCQRQQKSSVGFFKGSLTRAFRLQVFFMFKCPPGPWIFQ